MKHNFGKGEKMMRNYKVFLTCSLMLFIMISLGLNYNVNADMGAKPGITINLKNMPTSNYVIDLLEYAENIEEYYPDSNFSSNGRSSEFIDENGIRDKNGIIVYFDKIAERRVITVEQAKTLYNIDYDGWISSCTRNSLLWGGCSGNSEYNHYFNYFGTPTTYKVLILFNNGETRVTDVINRTDLQSEITIDVNTMGVTTKVNNTTENIKSNLELVLVPLLVTIMMEIIIAVFMKIKNMKVIGITNIITNTLLQLILINMPQSYIALFIISELVIFILEYLIYAKYIKETSKTKILCYTLISNLVTLALTFII